MNNNLNISKINKIQNLFLLVFRINIDILDFISFFKIIFMQDRIKQILIDIQEKKEQIKKDYEKLYQNFKEKYGFTISWKKVSWPKNKILELKKYKKSAIESIFSSNMREILSIPFIYAMLIPAIILDIFLFIYQQTALRLYKIPLVKRSDFIIFDRAKLPYLNWIQKLNCIYCSYFNGLMQFAVEVAWRTEKYWCPIKHAKKKYGEHNWEIHFAPYGDAKWFKQTFCSIKDFEDKENI